LLALTDGKGPLVGVAHFPALNETVYASQGNGCFWNGRQSHVSQINNLTDAVLLASEAGGYAKYGKEEAWQRLINATYFQRTWGDAYGYALVATGRAEIMLDAAMHVWDCGPLQVIMEEAGGTFTNWKGVPTIYGDESIATNGHLFDAVIKLINEI
jgi:histidinol-phosphatase